MATAVNDTGQWRMPWDLPATDMFDMFPDGVTPFNESMAVAPDDFWDLSGPVVAEDDAATMQKTLSETSQGSGNASSSHIDDPQQAEYDTARLPFNAEEASPQTEWTPASTRKRRSATPDMSPGTNSQTSSSSRPTKARRDRERNRVAAAKCRQKAKQSVSELQSRERELLQQNRFLTAHVGNLREEVLSLKNEILRHSQCDSDVIQTYINKAAREIR
ncbi:hypothetical protein SLS62_010575 [Diatrype stigma]|uniref:BZIP domain-containing protein n=1 Tax=Diatrype stigma TaxID=117547 RepID=A0AAN9UAU7_9PEZI